MSMTKRWFAVTTTFVTQVWGPTTIRISGDESVAGEIRPTEDGGVQFSFPERLVMIANHQVCEISSALAMEGSFGLRRLFGDC
jgi:hypothetical protein